MKKYKREEMRFAEESALMETMRDSKTGAVATAVAGATGFTAVVQHGESGDVRRHRIALVLLVDGETPTEMLAEFPVGIIHTLMTAWNDMMIGVFGPEKMAELMVMMLAEAHGIEIEERDTPSPHVH